MIKERALKIPATTEEMMESIAYIENAKTVGLQKLKERIKASDHIVFELVSLLITQWR